MWVVFESKVCHSGRCLSWWGCRKLGLSASFRSYSMPAYAKSLDGYIRIMLVFPSNYYGSVFYYSLGLSFSNTFRLSSVRCPLLEYESTVRYWQGCSVVRAPVMNGEVPGSGPGRVILKHFKSHRASVIQVRRPSLHTLGTSPSRFHVRLAYKSNPTI